MGEVQVTAQDGEVRVGLGDDLVVRLAENATTGYRWHMGPLPAAARRAGQGGAGPGPDGAGRVRRAVRAHVPARWETLETGDNYETAARAALFAGSRLGEITFSERLSQPYPRS